VLVIAFCDHELSDLIPGTMREPALIDQQICRRLRNFAGLPA
jgi:hypothetical protein